MRRAGPDLKAEGRADAHHLHRPEDVAAPLVCRPALCDPSPSVDRPDLDHTVATVSARACGSSPGSTERA
jgi:hypothetical protein